jgi:hypothetical protein
MGKPVEKERFVDKLVRRWEVENSDELGDDASFDQDVEETDYPDGFED